MQAHDEANLIAKAAAVVKQNGGWLISEPGKLPIKFACVPESPLPWRLQNLGFRMLRSGAAMRTLPGRDNGTQERVAVDVWVILPSSSC
jgi:hypothetical protein